MTSFPAVGEPFVSEWYAKKPWGSSFVVCGAMPRFDSGCPIASIHEIAVEVEINDVVVQRKTGNLIDGHMLHGGV